MRKPVVVMSCIVCTALAAGGAFASSEAFKSDLEKESYAVGVNMVKQLKASRSKYDVSAIAKGVKDAAAGTAQVSAAETEAALKKLREEAEKTAQIEFEKKAAENKKRGDAFLKEYAKKEGVKTLPSGVMYRVIKQGTGEKATVGDYILANYRGTLVDGREFDGTPPEKPTSLKMRKMLPGLMEAALEMPAGSKWEIVIPPQEGFGESGSKIIGPNETLIYALEILEVE